MKGYIKLRKEIIEILNTKLSKNLYYHGAHHSFTALDVCEHYLKYENIKGHQAKLLRIGILLHDIGFIVSYENHELVSSKIAVKLMTKHDCSKTDIEIVKNLILSTKLPQKPRTKLEQIICDVDLDYLGGNNYTAISNQLYKELKIFSTPEILKDWNKSQLHFLKTHKYHTNFAKRFRKPRKEKIIKELELLAKENVKTTHNVEKEKVMAF
jgi:uncharacterized protein